MCQKMATRASGPLLLDHARQQREMIILHQHDGFFLALHLLEQGVGEFPVHGAVMLPILGAEDRPRVGDVAERPESFVGESEIEALLLFRA